MHAWIETSDGHVYDPVPDTYEPTERYYAKRLPVVDRRYDRGEAMRLIGETDHSGPWFSMQEAAVAARDPAQWFCIAYDGSGVARVWANGVTKGEALKRAKRAVAAKYQSSKIMQAGSFLTYHQAMPSRL
jgi:hypothetical protein